jgi:signal transduction histidine kinase
MIRTIIDDLLRFARAGASPSPGASADVATVLENVGDEIRPAAESARVELCVEALDPCRASCSAGVLTSVVSNLAHNALKHMGDAGTRRITLRSRSCAREDLVRVEVEDSGPGLPEELAGRIFRPFVRGPTQDAEGLGLGLATVQRLCESHGGRAGVCSAVGRGSTFWVELPKKGGRLARGRGVRQSSRVP